MLALQDQPKPKVLPNFESYIVEDEEGSGNGALIVSCFAVTSMPILLINEGKTLNGRWLWHSL